MAPINNTNGTVNTSVDFSPSNYANINTDVKNTVGTNPYNLALHWVAYGQGEERTYVPGNTGADYSAVVKVDDLNTALESTDLSVDNGVLSLNIGPIFKTYKSGDTAGDVGTDATPITTSVRVNPLLNVIDVTYPKTFQYSSNSTLSLSPINLDLTNYSNFYIELDGTQYYADSVTDPVVNLIPDGPVNATGNTAKTIQSYWGKTGNIFVKAIATIISTGQITSYPNIANDSPNAYLYDIVEFTNKIPNIMSTKEYKYFLTKYKYNNSSTIKAFFQTNIPTYADGIPKPGSSAPLVLIDTANSPKWLIGSSVFDGTMVNKHYSTSYRPIDYVYFNSVDNTLASETSYTGITLSPTYYTDKSYTVYEEDTWWVYFDSGVNNKITPLKCPDYGTGNTVPLDTVDVVYGLSDSANKAFTAAIKTYLDNNGNLLSSSGGNLSNIVVTKSGDSGTIKFKNFIQSADISIDLFNDLTDLGVWGVTPNTTKYNTILKSFLNITVSYTINDQTKDYVLWGQNLKLGSITAISVDTYTAPSTKTSVDLIAYPVFYCNIPITPGAPASPYVEKWYTSPAPLTSTNNDFVQGKTLYSSKPFLYTASLNAYVYSVTPFVFNLPRLLISETNLYKNDRCTYDSGFTALDAVLNSQINYANSYTGLNDILTGKDGASLDMISLVDRSAAAINIINRTGNPGPGVTPGSIVGPAIGSNSSNIVYPNPIYDFDSYNLPVGGKITVLVSYNYTVVPLLSQTNTILALNETYRHYKLAAPVPPPT
jgi:hypothetical protein